MKSLFFYKILQLWSDVLILVNNQLMRPGQAMNASLNRLIPGLVLKPPHACCGPVLPGSGFQTPARMDGELTLAGIHVVKWLS